MSKEGPAVWILREEVNAYEIRVLLAASAIAHEEQNAQAVGFFADPITV